MSTFRNASLGVWCLSWHPWSDDVCFERLDSVLANNRVARHGQQKAVLAVLGHQPGDMMVLTDDGQNEHHGLSAQDATRTFQVCRQQGLLPTYFPISLDCVERWRWLIEG
jgi:hypothetical protein